MGSKDKSLYTDYNCDYKLGFLCNCIEHSDGTFYCPKDPEDYKKEYLCSYDHWASGQPNHQGISGSETNCGAMYGGWVKDEDQSHFTDYKCEYKLGFLCNCIQQKDGSYECPEPKPDSV